MKDWRDNIYFILIEPKEPGNIGASARAIKNMGFRNLCLVNPSPITDDAARCLAYNAVDVLKSAGIYNNLKDAIMGKSVVVGTTRRTGRKRGLFFTAEDCAKNLFETAHNNKIAVLFGREDKGLLNEEVEECGFLITIPSSKEQPSLNLSQAVLLTAYELSKYSLKIQTENKIMNEKVNNKSGDRHYLIEKERLVFHKELMNLYSRIASALKKLGYIPRGNMNIEGKIMLNLKHFIGRAGLTEWELRMLHGVCSQIEKKVNNTK